VKRASPVIACKKAASNRRITGGDLLIKSTDNRRAIGDHLLLEGIENRRYQDVTSC
jgi:hypothetical protein